MTWAPSRNARDWSNHRVSTATVTETAPADVEF